MRSAYWRPTNPILAQPRRAKQQNLSRPSHKNIPLYRISDSAYMSWHPARHEGRIAIVRYAGRGAVDADSAVWRCKTFPGGYAGTHTLALRASPEDACGSEIRWS